MENEFSRIEVRSIVPGLCRSLNAPNISLNVLGAISLPETALELQSTREWDGLPQMRVSLQSQRFTWTKPGLHIFWCNSWRDDHQWCRIHFTSLCLQCGKYLQGQRSCPPGLFYFLHCRADRELGGPSCMLTSHVRLRSGAEGAVAQCKRTRNPHIRPRDPRNTYAGETKIEVERG